MPLGDIGMRITQGLGRAGGYIYIYIYIYIRYREREIDIAIYIYIYTCIIDI